MGLLHRNHGSEAQIIKIHHRRLRNTPLPNSARFAHWALQVGDYFYVVAAPPKDIVKLKLVDDRINEIQGMSGEDDQDEDDDDDQDEHDAQDDEDDEDDQESDNQGSPNDSNIDTDLEAIESLMENALRFSNKNNYKAHTMRVYTEKGREVPL